MAKYEAALRIWALTKLGSRAIALSLSYIKLAPNAHHMVGDTFTASGKEATLMYAAARFA
jgi:hypothetical protein